MLVIGANGFFGKKFVKKFDARPSTIHFKSPKEIEKEIEQTGAEIVLNCAGKTGKPNVDWCEQNKFETYDSNVVLPINIAKACELKNVKMVHLGSGCVYAGNKRGHGFSEDDKPNFYGSFYSRTKAMSEDILKEQFPNVLQLRIRMPIDTKPSEKNLITKLSKYKKIINIENSVTFVDDLIKATENLITQNEKGIFNIVNTPALTHKEIMTSYYDIIDPSLSQEFISIEELESFTLAERSNCVLNTQKLANAGIKLKDSKSALIETMKKYKKEMN